MHEIIKQKKLRSSASKANKDCQILLFDVHVANRIPKKSFPRCITKDDGEQAVSTLHSNVQPLFSLIEAIVLRRSRRRCRPHILKFLVIMAAKVVVVVIMILTVAVMIKTLVYTKTLESYINDYA